ncbi:hypothetical protein [Streptomyces turgidiscabies]|uniref:hypothetical protein n=1 Tax=Streptomyces turgidiscabies TaxID=85558 RepID=UPI0038F802BF
MRTIDPLPQGKPLALLREADRIAKEIKAPQILGSSSILGNRVYSADAWDVLTPASGVHTCEIEFVPDDLTFGGAFAYTLVVVDVTGTPVEVTTGIYRLRVTDDRQRWKMAVSNSQKLKFYFLTAGSGTFTTNVI